MSARRELSRHRTTFDQHPAASAAGSDGFAGDSHLEPVRLADLRSAVEMLGGARIGAPKWIVQLLNWPRQNRPQLVPRRPSRQAGSRRFGGRPRLAQSDLHPPLPQRALPNTAMRRLGGANRALSSAGVPSVGYTAEIRADSTSCSCAISEGHVLICPRWIQRRSEGGANKKGAALWRGPADVATR
jgi:hypothetical protein